MANDEKNAEVIFFYISRVSFNMHILKKTISYAFAWIKRIQISLKLQWILLTSVNLTMGVQVMTSIRQQAITWPKKSPVHLYYFHDEVIEWKHFPRYWPFGWGIHRSPVNSPHKGQWRGALMWLVIWDAIALIMTSPYCSCSGQRSKSEAKWKFWVAPAITLSLAAVLVAIFVIVLVSRGKVLTEFMCKDNSQRFVGQIKSLRPSDVYMRQ